MTGALVIRQSPEVSAETSEQVRTQIRLDFRLWIVGLMSTTFGAFAALTKGTDWLLVLGLGVVALGYAVIRMSRAVRFERP